LSPGTRSVPTGGLRRVTHTLDPDWSVISVTLSTGQTAADTDSLMSLRGRRGAATVDR
jgi:hypothetical protein